MLMRVIVVVRGLQGITEPTIGHIEVGTFAFLDGDGSASALQGEGVGIRERHAGGVEQDVEHLGQLKANGIVRHRNIKFQTCYGIVFHLNCRLGIMGVTITTEDFVEGESEEVIVE